jgi:hypothetical protein
MSHKLPTPSDKFIHVVYEHRYFALAARGWNQFGPSGTSEVRQGADNLLPGIAVLIQDSLLMRARLLIDFYTKKPSSNTSSKVNTDIILADFGLPTVSSTLSARLEEYKHPIEVHVLHMTDWRDVDYRKQKFTTSKDIERQQERQRIDWNMDNAIIVNLLLQALDEVSKSASNWGVPFHHLYSSVKSILDNTFTDLPKGLLEKSDIIAYLKGLGLN